MSDHIVCHPILKDGFHNGGADNGSKSPGCEAGGSAFDEETH